MTASEQWTAGLNRHRAIGERATRLANQAWRLAIAQAAKAHPETGGSPLLVHNWGNDRARAAMARKDRRSNVIYAWQQQQHAAIWRAMQSAA